MRVIARRASHIHTRPPRFDLLPHLTVVVIEMQHNEPHDCKALMKKAEHKTK